MGQTDMFKLVQHLVVQEDGKPDPVVQPRRAVARHHINQEDVLRDGEDVRALGLPVPARDAGEAMRDVLDLDVERGGIEQVESAARQHALPGAGLSFVVLRCRARGFCRGFLEHQSNEFCGYGRYLDLASLRQAWCR